MAERLALLRVDMGGEESRRISYSQKRLPYFNAPGNGYRYGPSAGSTNGPVRTLFIEQIDDTGLVIVHHARESAGSSGLILGAAGNQVDVCAWGVPEDALIDSDVLDTADLQVEVGDIAHKWQGTFDRRVVVPIRAGTLSLHLATKNWEPTAL